MATPIHIMRFHANECHHNVIWEELGMRWPPASADLLTLHNLPQRSLTRHASSPLTFLYPPTNSQSQHDEQGTTRDGRHNKVPPTQHSKQRQERAQPSPHVRGAQAGIQHTRWPCCPRHHAKCIQSHGAWSHNAWVNRESAPALSATPLTVRPKPANS